MTRKRLLFNLELWLRARILPLQLRGESLPRLLDLATPKGPPAYAGLEAAYVLRRVERSLRRPWAMRGRRCLRLGLLGFRFLREAGYEPRLHFGVDPASLGAARLAAHCWIELDGRTALGASPIPLTTIHIHPRPGA